jgi:hypothetical protein
MPVVERARTDSGLSSVATRGVLAPRVARARFTSSGKQRKGSPTAMAPAKKMSDAHKKALAHGRELGRAVRDYLEYLEWTKPTRGRKRDTSPERIAEVDAQLADADSPLQRLQLIQLRKDLEAAAETDDDPAEAERLRKAFVKAARPYSQSKGITYGTWREAGVPADVLRDAGITRSGS